MHSDGMAPTPHQPGSYTCLLCTPQRGDVGSLCKKSLQASTLTLSTSKRRKLCCWVLSTPINFSTCIHCQCLHLGQMKAVPSLGASSQRVESLSPVDLRNWSLTWLCPTSPTSKPQHLKIRLLNCLRQAQMGHALESPLSPRLEQVQTLSLFCILLWRGPREDTLSCKPQHAWLKVD